MDYDVTMNFPPSFDKFSFIISIHYLKWWRDFIKNPGKVFYKLPKSLSAPWRMESGSLNRGLGMRSYERTNHTTHF